MVQPQHKTLFGLMGFGIFAFVVGVFLYGVVAKDMPIAPHGHIAVVGVGEASAIPSEARLTVTISERAATSAAASRLQLSKVAMLIGLVDADFGEAMRFTSDTVSLTSFDNSRRFQEEGVLVKGYQASQTLTFRFDDADAAARFYPKLTDHIDGITTAISFQFGETAALYAKARELAVQAARVRAETYAQQAGALLGAVEIIEEAGTGDYRIPFDLYDRITRQFRATPSGGLEEVALSSALTRDAVSPQRLILSPDARSVSVKIYARFALK